MNYDTVTITRTLTTTINYDKRNPWKQYGCAEKRSKRSNEQMVESLNPRPLRWVASTNELQWNEEVLNGFLKD